MLSSLEFEDLDRYLLAQNGRIIHQIWFGTMPDARAARKAYGKLKRYRDSWKVQNPTWCHLEWSKDMCVEFMRSFFPEHTEMFAHYRYEIQRCDAIRYFILYRYGGLYADMDYHCCLPFDKVLGGPEHDSVGEFPGDFYLVETPNAIGNDRYISNSLMYSVPRHPFWRTVFLELQKHRNDLRYSKHLHVMFRAGPGFLNRVFQRHKYRMGLKSFPKEQFQPFGTRDELRALTATRRGKQSCEKPVYAVHVSQGCWHGRDRVAILFITQNWPVVLLTLLVIAIPLLWNWCHRGEASPRESAPSAPSLEAVELSPTQPFKSAGSQRSDSLGEAPSRS